MYSSNPDCGVVTGSGTHQYGQFALLEAYPAEGYEFVGWYGEGETCVSEDAAYRICVTDNIALTGVFQCSHLNTEIQNAEEASCTETGYTGDTVCTECGQIISSGSIITALGHSYVNGKCSVCGTIELRLVAKVSVVVLCIVVIGLLVARTVKKRKANDSNES